MVLRGLTTRTDLPICVNQEQTPKPIPTGKLEQTAIDRAFQNAARLSTYAFDYEQSTIVLLSGKNTGNYGVDDVTDESGERYPTTSIARTLVDITVRPTYGGGVQNVLEAFRRATAIGQPDHLTAQIEKVLDHVGHAYPYHQSIGFYLERAGVDNTHTKRFSARGINYDFYLDYEIPTAAHDKKWRIYFPSDLG